MAYEKRLTVLACAVRSWNVPRRFRAAISQGMPLNEIERYLDWLDLVRPPLAESKRPYN